MIEKVRRQIVERGAPAVGERVLVGISGGPDSVALLHVLWRLREEFDLQLHAAHLDHALRPESPAEAQFVASLSAGLDIPLITQRIAVAQQQGRGQGGLEQVARHVRRRFLFEAAARAQCDSIALGHHRGDQAETLLLRLLRGSGPGGLAAMRARTGRLVRPLLEVARDEILAYLHAQGLRWIEDASNADLRFTRNRIRAEVLPLLQTFNPRIEESLARLAQRFACEEDYWEAHIQVPQPQGEELRLPLVETRKSHSAVRDRSLRKAVAQVRGDLRGFEEKHVAALVELLMNFTGAQREVHLPGLWAAASHGGLRLRRRAPPAAEPFVVNIPAPGDYVLPDGRVLRVSLAAESLGEAQQAVEFCAAQAPFPLRLRSWRPGDRIRPAGMVGRKKIKDVFLEARVPPELRMRIPLLLCAEQVLWVAGLRRCAGLRPVANQGEILRVVLDDAKMETLRL